MPRINRQTDYAVRVILALSKKEVGKRVSTSEIGREMLIPPALLQRIVAELASGKFINTHKPCSSANWINSARLLTASL